MTNMGITTELQPDGGTKIYVNGVMCMYWYHEDCPYNEAVEFAVDTYTMMHNGDRRRQEDRELLAFARAMRMW